jgi:conjugal transfer mating pair stabilization protein TraG
MYEFITIGGGEYFVDFFNGLASLIKSEDYLDTVKITGTIAFMWVLLNAAFEGSLESTTKWFITVFMVTQILLTPKTTLHITDKTNPALQGATVDNVPFVIAYVASASSQVGYSLTKQFEAVYSLPDDLKYQQNGMIFGVNLLETMTTATIYNSKFSASMDSFIRNCIFYDLMLESYSFDDIKSTNDIWGLITPLQTENRFFTYTTDGNSVEYPTCKDGVAKLEADWANKEMAEWKNPLSKKVNFQSSAFTFGTSKTALRQKILTSIASSSDSVSDYLLGVSMNADQILKQAMTNNAIISATENYEAEYSQQQYQNARATLQARSTYQTIGAQAGHWLPMLKIVIESIFYAVFPIIVLLAIIPNMTVGVLKGYFATFFWLASWAPLYAILNRIITEYSANKMTDGAGLSLLNQQNLQIITADISAMAGYLAMFIPIIAAGLAKGGVATMSSMSTAFLSVAQGAASQAANEGVTGNLAFGNVGMNSRQVHSGVTMQQESGMLTHFNRDGSTSMSMGTAESNTGYNIQASDRLENMASESITQEQSLAHSKGVQSQQLEARGFESILQNHRNIENSKQFSESATAEEKMAASRITNTTEAFAKEHNITRGKSAEILARVGVGISAEGKISSQDQDLYQQAQRYSQEHNLSQDFNVVKNAVQSDHLNLTDSQGQSINDTFYKSAQLSQEKSTHLENAQRYSEQQQFIKSNSAQIDHNYNQEFYNYIKSNIADGSVSKASELFNPNNSGRHEILDKASSDFLESKFHKNEISHDLGRDYAAEAAKIQRNGPQNMMQNIAPPHWNDEFKSIDNSGLESSVAPSYDGMKNQINSQTIEQSTRSEVTREHNKGLLGGPDKYDIQKIYEEKKNNEN